MTYYIHADKFFLENRTENGGYLEIQDNGKFGFTIQKIKSQMEELLIIVENGLLPDMLTHTFMAL